MPAQGDCLHLQKASQSGHRWNGELCPGAVLPALSTMSPSSGALNADLHTCSLLDPQSLSLTVQAALSLNVQAALQPQEHMNPSEVCSHHLIIMSIVGACQAIDIPVIEKDASFWIYMQYKLDSRAGLCETVVE